MIDIYKDIACRTKGDIYVGVVGPVRTGKSTFIAKMMDSLVLPNITNSYDKDRAMDEMPQSGDGKSIMTTQPHFVPNDAVAVTLNNATMNMRMVDCVGYMVAGALGNKENDRARLIDTPWSEEPMPFEEAAEFGTSKVIDTHSTMCVMVTCDGSMTGLDRSDYVKAEEQCIDRLKASDKPFVVVYNTTEPKSSATKSAVAELSKKYGVSVVAMNVKNMTENDIDQVFTGLLSEFPITTIDVDMPKWLRALPNFHPIIEEVKREIADMFMGTNRVGDVEQERVMFANSEYFEPTHDKNVELSTGRVIVKLEPKPDLFYKVLSEQCGMDIASDYDLISYVKELSVAKVEYDKIKTALDEVKVNGYGVVCPSLNEMVLEEPQVMKSGGRYGVKLKATAPSLHIMQVDVNTEVSPIMGTEQQSEEMVNYLLDEYKNNPDNFWETKMFGKTLSTMVGDDLVGKVYAMPKEVQKKMRRTVGRIVNEGKGGVICILL